MFKPVNLLVVTLIVSLSSQAYAHQMSLRLNPKMSKVVTNNYAWTLEANCTIQAQKAKNKILVSVLKNKGRVNGRSLANGQATSVYVNNNDSISVSAEPGATVNIKNLGTGSILASCSA